MRAVIDIEADGLSPSIIWLVVLKDIDTNELYTFRDAPSFQEFLRNNHLSLVVSHNGIDYDWFHLNRLWGINIPQGICRDTLVLSRLHNQRLEGGHSLEAWGQRLGFPKGESPRFDCYSTEMLEYCINDVHLNHKLYLYLEKIFKFPVWKKPIELEHEMGFICRDMHVNGFSFNEAKAREIYIEILNQVNELDKLIKQEFKPISKPFKEPTVIRISKDGSINKGSIKWYEGYEPVSFSDTCHRFVWEEFNPESSKQICHRLQGYWSPIDKTDGHKDNKDKKKSKYFEVYGWKVNETNIGSLHEDAPEAAKLLVKRILLGSRLRTLTTWINSVQWDISIKKNKESIDEIGRRINEEVTRRGLLMNVDTIMSEEERKLWKKWGDHIGTCSDTLNKKNVSDDITLKTRMELLLNIMNNFLYDRKVVVRYAEEERDNSLLITVTRTEGSEDFCVDSVIRNLAGLKTDEKLSKNISTKIRGKFNSLGTWTHRLSHTDPNLGNVSAEKTIKYNTEELRKIAIHYGGEMRKLFVADPGAYLVGTDMEGAHLRLFAHFIKDKQLIEALVSGKKELGTDPHTVNKNKLGIVCPDRDRAKTFIFTYLNGGGYNKVKEIFNCTYEEAKYALDGFVQSYPGLVDLKNTRIPVDAKRGYFIGFDGRKVPCDSEHFMIAGYLQCGEAVVMKYANTLWRKELDKLGIKYKQVNLVHDEYQTNVFGSLEEAEMVGKIQSQAITQAGIDFGIICPLSGEYSIGKDWLESH